MTCSLVFARTDSSNSVSLVCRALSKQKTNMCKSVNTSSNDILFVRRCRLLLFTCESAEESEVASGTRALGFVFFFDSLFQSKASSSSVVSAYLWHLRFSFSSVVYWRIPTFVCCFFITLAFILSDLQSLQLLLKGQVCFISLVFFWPFCFLFWRLQSWDGRGNRHTNMALTYNCYAVASFRLKWEKLNLVNKGYKKKKKRIANGKRTPAFRSFSAAWALVSKPPFLNSPSTTISDLISPFWWSQNF